MKYTLNRKGQGLTEYGIILLLILGIGMTVWFHWNARNQISSMYSTIASDLKSIAGGVDKYADDVETFVLEKTRDGRYHIGPYTFHKTSLTFADKGYNGKDDVNNGNADDRSIWWFINSSGYKEYKVGKGNRYGSLGGMLQEVPSYADRTYGYNITAAETYTYFKATDGNTYQITYYRYNPKGTTITQYTGDMSKITLVDSNYTGYADGQTHHY